MSEQIKRLLLISHAVPEVAADALAETLGLCRRHGVEVVVPAGESQKHGDSLHSESGYVVLSDNDALEGVDLCLVLGGDGTMLRALQLTRDRSIPVAGVNLGRVGFLTTIAKDALAEGLARLLVGEFRVYPLLCLQAQNGDSTHSATNDVVVHRGNSPTACSLGLRINGVTLFEVQCDGVVVGTPAGSSAYSLAAGGPLLGVSVDAYVITLVAAHAVGVRPVVAAPTDVLDIINMDHQACHLDVDGQRTGELQPGDVVSIHTVPGAALALLEGDSLYHHFRDRLL